MCSKTHTSSRTNKISQTKLHRTQFLSCKSFPSRNYYLSIHHCCNKDRLQSSGSNFGYMYHLNIIHMDSMMLLVQISSEYYIHLLEWSSLLAGKDIDCRRDTVGLISNRLRYGLIRLLGGNLHPLSFRRNRIFRQHNTNLLYKACRWARHNIFLLLLHSHISRTPICIVNLNSKTRVVVNLRTFQHKYKCLKWE